MKNQIRISTMIAVLCCFFQTASEATATPIESPNIVVILIDDLGYADIGPFGGQKARTPNLNRMANEGRRFTNFHVSSAVCSASRAALLTGCYHERVGISGALSPSSRIGLSASEVTLAEICKQKNYATTCIGKWHLGHHAPFLPTQHGFDSFFGLPYSNDMWPNHPEVIAQRKSKANFKEPYPPLPLIENTTTIDSEVDADEQSQLTSRYTDAAVRFIRSNKDRPFFVYLPHSMVHVPLFVSDKFAGKSGEGLFGDVIMEIDWSVGQILDVLQQCGIDVRTLVIFTSDNGPWLSYGNHAGSSGPFREGKGTSWDGGTRVPTLMRWVGVIPENTSCDELASTVDLLPTVASLLKTKPPEQKIDGKDISNLMLGAPGAVSPHDNMPCYYANGQLQGVRDRDWKLMLPHTYRTLSGRAGGKDGVPAPYGTEKTGLELYDLRQDPGELQNVAAQHPEVVERLQMAAEVWRSELGDSISLRQGTGVRQSGVLPKNP